MDDSSLIWDDGVLLTIDQRGLPHEARRLRLGTVDEIIEAIATLAIRGAPAIGIAGAFGVVIAARAHTAADGVLDLAAVEAEAARIIAVRPTAVNLAWAVRRATAAAARGADAALAETLDMLAEDGRVNRAAATNAADLVRELLGDRPVRALTHCNTGRLATSAFGTAIGALRVLFERGALAEVLVDETRPLLQGARLTAWELAEAGIPHRLTIDSAAAWAMATGQVDCVLVGADRITANGDVANKIGTYMLALAARHHGIPFIVVAPESTRDTAMATGAQIVVERRGAAEVSGFAGVATAPAGTEVFNPAFDVTPAALVTAIVTEAGVVYREGGAGAAIAEVARELYRNGWMPGTAGNISVRQGDSALITGSGLSKGELGAADMVTVRVADSAPVSAQARRPSAETTIHTAVYRRTDAAAVVHVHPPYATTLCTLAGEPDRVTTVRIGDYELIKGLGVADPSVIDIPIFPNWREVARIGADVERYLTEYPYAPPVFGIAGHGVTTWGDTLAQARDRAECLEALCELVTRTGRRGAFAAEAELVEIGRL
ncbi:bifunctional S-methyl-5-thioribose-1-phosphate isomerase/methylthioribulose 1-phosphate dehydratase [Nocardia arizonensis]|uniref:bifunctional S-methyl-5-thioribose-1-phosphate isomerase/methylthioribulose 1-phosphate dehydratase n=1 Tax=Nocardia arizonensis TaxID=1141647 RepID=UPI0009EAAE11|nr:bifunctional S-methyl-5-thioribose-1-phosphate isomerase/methylthioribulose 1-phosphate dehydratase [Nocardia arizonensis]